jgi:hypothetical protein
MAPAYHYSKRAGAWGLYLLNVRTNPSSMAVKKVFQIMIVLLCSIDAILFVQAAGLAINSSPCQASCGNVSIPYPFGIGAGCYVDPWFEVACINNNDSLGSPKPVLKSLNLEVLSISFSPSRNTYSWRQLSDTFCL